MAEAKLLTPDRMTVEEFLDWDSTGHIGKLELVDGVVRAMSPASGTHAIIQANLAFLIGSHLRKHRPGCRVGTETPVVPRLHANDNVRAPDLAVTCVPPSAQKTFPDPILIVEVLSPSNVPETWESIRAVATVPTLTEILVVDSVRVQVEVLARDSDGGWPNNGTIIESGSVRLASLDLTIALADIYAGTHLGV